MSIRSQESLPMLRPQVRSGRALIPNKSITCRVYACMCGEHGRTYIQQPILLEDQDYPHSSSFHLSTSSDHIKIGTSWRHDPRPSCLCSPSTQHLLGLLTRNRPRQLRTMGARPLFQIPKARHRTGRACPKRSPSRLLMALRNCRL